MSSTKQIAAERRERAGKGAARAVRRDNRVPAVIYGGGAAPLLISLDYKQTNSLIYAGHFLTTVFEIDVSGEKIRAIPRDYQLDVVKDTPVHVDFQRLTAGSKIKVEVPVHFINQETSPGMKRGGVLNIVHHAIELLVPADAIPDSLTVDLATADMGASIHLSAISLPANTKAVTREKDYTIATIAAPAGLKEEPAAAEAAPAAAPAAKASSRRSRPASCRPFSFLHHAGEGLADENHRWSWQSRQPLCW
jgi:large subunit ribosomal protein L25